MKDTVYIGQLIKKELRRQGKTTAWLAEKIYVNPREIYRIFNKESINTQQLLLISNALKCDFFKYYSQSIEMTN